MYSAVTIALPCMALMHSQVRSRGELQRGDFVGLSEGRQHLYKGSTYISFSQERYSKFLVEYLSVYFFHNVVFVPLSI